MTRTSTMPGLERLPWHIRGLTCDASIGFEAGDANLYRYVKNSPTNFTDPSGLWLYVPIVDKDKWEKTIPGLTYRDVDKRGVVWEIRSIPGYVVPIIPEAWRNKEKHDEIRDWIHTEYGIDGDVLKEAMRSLYGGNIPANLAQPNDDLGIDNRKLDTRYRTAIRKFVVDGKETCVTYRTLEVYGGYRVPALEPLREAKRNEQKLLDIHSKGFIEALAAKGDTQSYAVKIRESQNKIYEIDIQIGSTYRWHTDDEFDK